MLARGTVEVGRLAVRTVPGGRLGGDAVLARQRAERLVGGLSHAGRQRSVLVVRRFEWPIGVLDADEVCRRLADLGRTAVRAEPGRSVAGAAAVWFADEVELLSYLTRAAVTGQLGQWHWRRLVRSPAAPTGTVLAEAWCARPRWVPAALTALPTSIAVRAVATLDGYDAGRVVAALRDEFGLPAPRIDTAAARSADDPEPPVAPWFGLAPAPTQSPVALHQHQSALLGLAHVLARRPAALLRPDFAELVERWLSEPPPAVVAAPDSVERAAPEPVGPAWDGVRSEFASILYLINVLPWLSHGDESNTGWAVIEAIARRMLDDDDAADDPLWTELAVWDGRDPREPTPEPPATVTTWCAMVTELLADYEVAPDALRQPGLVVATATHVDVVFDIDQIDLAVRICGLDRDPGWVPELGRIVAFHFESPDR